jgi:inhibitor of cysteine peptidase
MKKAGKRSLEYLKITVFLLLICTIVLSGCADKAGNNTEPGNNNNTSQENDTQENSSTESNSTDYIYGTAAVDTVQILTLESFPVQIHVLAEGYLPDSCTEIDNVSTTKDGNNFNVTITTKRPKDAMCTQVIVPFNKTIPLEVQGLKAGNYTVDVNGVKSSFVLSIDNTLDEPSNTMPPRQDVITEANNGTTINVKNGETFYLRLKENPTTGYAWQLNLSEGLSIVPGQDKYYPESTEGEHPLVGAGGVHLWEIKANTPGNQQVNGIYKRSWENTTGDENTFMLNVEVA